MPDARHDAVIRRPFGAATELWPQANRSRLSGVTRTSLTLIMPGRGDLALLLEQPGVSLAAAAVPQLLEVGGGH
jgi:hypothetical protein